MALTARQGWMGLLAQADPCDLAAALQAMTAPPPYEKLRGPEIGMTMLRGRVGGDGEPFNLGEMTLTRCSVQLGCGTVGHAWIKGRDENHAEQAAWIDALLQRSDPDPVLTRLLDDLEKGQTVRRQQAAARAASTKVEFFTLVRGA